MKWDLHSENTKKKKQKPALTKKMTLKQAKEKQSWHVWMIG